MTLSKGYSFSGHSFQRERWGCYVGFVFTSYRSSANPCGRTVIGYLSSSEGSGRVCGKHRKLIDTRTKAVLTVLQNLVR